MAYQWHWNNTLILQKNSILLQSVSTIILDSRFWDKVNKTDNCWEWTAYTLPSGYGQFNLNGKRQRSHRLSYEDVKGKIPKGLELDHLCRNPACVNPDHLEAVTHQENVKRGLAGFLTGLRKRMTKYCPQNHEYTVENTYNYYRKNGNKHRVCKICCRELARLYRQHKKLKTKIPIIICNN